MTSLNGPVSILSPGAPPVDVSSPSGGSVVVSPGQRGPAGRDLQIDGTAEHYEALLSVTPVRVGELWQALDTGMVYTWTASGWPAEAQGQLLQGPQGDKGETGRGISALSVDGGDLVAEMTTGPVERVQVPSIVASAESAVAAASSAVLADSHRQAAQEARSGAETARDEAQGIVDSIPDLEIVPESHKHVSTDITDAQHGTLPNVIIRRDENGLFTVADPVEDTHPVSKSWAVAQIAAAMADATGMTPEQVEMLQGLADQVEAAAAAAEQFVIEAGGHADTASGYADLATSIAEQIVLDWQELEQEFEQVVGGRIEEIAALAAGVQQVVDDAAAAVRAGVEADADRAVTAASSSESSADRSEAARTGSEAARTGAETAQGLAEGHAVAAGEHANAADSSAIAAASSESQAGAHAAAAAGHADRAEGAATGAEQSATDASASASAASGYADAATTAAAQVALDRQAVGQDRSEVEGLAAGVSQVVNDAAAAVRAEVADDVTAAQTARQGAEEARDLAQARPAMWLWDGAGSWQAPANAAANDSVLNLDTGEIHSIEEVA